LAAAEGADDFYFDAFAQVHMETFSSGRATLVGDADYCASPLSGMGTSLVLVGA
jgi:2-polyprenyl-6-methoxyphenol hydroxylase-like FAD-dependent oxidoreductase